MGKRFGGIKVFGFGLLFAAVGFSYALATSTFINEGPTAETRAGSTTSSIAGDLRFTNAILAAGIDSDYLLGGDVVDPKVYDLGDAVAGTHEITRYVTAAGGLRPYTFTSTNLTTLASTLTLDTTGVLTGTVGSGVSNPLRFHVTVTDSETTGSNTVTGLFRIGLVAEGEFRFLVSALNNGLLGLSYVSKLETAGGNLPITFSVVAGSVKLDGTAKDDLETLGLTVAESGEVYGQPLAKGTVTFTARATDSAGNTALGRTPAATSDQEITIVVEDNSIVASDMTITKADIKIDKQKDNKDSVRFDAFLNTQAKGLSAISSKSLTVRVGGETITGTFDSKGKIKTKEKTDKKNISLSTKKGQLKFKFDKADLGDAFGTISGSTKRVGIMVVVEGVVTASAIIDMQVKKNDSKKSQLTFKLGKSGSALAGAFQILSLKGKDDKKSGGVKWKSKLFAVPRQGIETDSGFDSVSQIDVLIGSAFSQTFSNPSTSSDVKFKATDKGAQVSNKSKSEEVKKVKLDNKKFVSQFQTNGLTSTSTGIGQGASSTANSTEDFGLVLVVTRGTKSGYTGVAGRAVTNGSKAKGWTDAVK